MKYAMEYLTALFSFEDPASALQEVEDNDNNFSFFSIIITILNFLNESNLIV